ncbi:MAG: beta-galactosidase [Lentisphaeria bacterium]|nr:beta-galactosidase [Lentisphaeria bacterium]
MKLKLASFSRFLLVVFFLNLQSLYSQVTNMLDKNQPYDKLSEKLITPHTRWAKPYAQGSIKALILAPALAHRETLELAQRLSLDYSAVMTFSYTQMYQDVKWQPHGLPAATVERIIKSKLKKEYDVIIIGKLSWKMLPEYLRQWIIKQVDNGTGLVYVCPQGCEEIQSWFDHEKTSPDADWIMACAPLKYLPLGKKMKDKKIVALSRHNKARIVKFDYNESHIGNLYALTPSGGNEDKPIFYDYYQSMMAKAVVWAAAKKTALQIMEMKNNGQELSVKIGKQDRARKNVLLELLVRDENNQVESRQHQQIIFNGNECRASFQLPVLKEGLHFQDLWVKENGKILDWKSSVQQLDSECRIEEISLDKASPENMNLLAGKVVCTRKPNAEASLLVKVLDNFNRVLQEKYLTELDKETDFSVEIGEPLTLLLKIVAELTNDGLVLSVKEKEFTAKPKTIDDYFFAMWIGGCEGYLGDLALKQFFEQGVDYNYSVPNAERNQKNVRANLKLIPYFSRSYFPGYGYSKMGQEDLQRNPCFSDPEFRLRLKNELQQKTLINKPYSPYYSLSINAGISPLRCITPLDLCFSPTCQKSFREYLKREYTSLEALNKQWETAFNSWDEIKAMTFAQARKHGNFSPWADHRMHMEGVFTDINRFSKKVILEMNPDAIIGIDEPNATSSYNGYQWWNLMQELDFCNPYFGKWHWRDDQLQLARCLVKKKEAPRGIWFGTYWRGEEFNRYIPWQSLFNGMNGVYWWVGMGEESIGALANDFTPLPYFSEALKQINEIKNGIGKLLINCSRNDDKIAIHFSQSCIHAATIEANMQLPPEKFPEEAIIRDCMAEPDTPTQFGSSHPLYRAQVAFMTLIEDLGLQYEFLNNEQIEAGSLSEKGYKVLVLPYAKAMSKAETEAIKTFVGNGGLLLADRIPAVMDQHCKERENPLLQELFADFDEKLKINKYGKGHAVLLHDYLDDYVFKLRQNNDEAEKREKIRKLIKLAGIEAKLQILNLKKQPLGSCETVFFKSGQIEYACLLRDYFTAAEDGNEASLVFPRPAHIYDLRQGKYYGWSKHARTELPRGQAQVFAMSPYKVKALKLALTQNKYRRAERISFSLEIEADSTAKSGHAFRIELINPKNKVVKHYSKNLWAEDGSCQHSFQFSLNEQQGQWMIVARDVMSGKIAKKAFFVE